MSLIQLAKRDIVCDFCQRSVGETKYLIAAPSPGNSHICDECVPVCVRIMAEEDASAAKAEEDESAR